MLLSDTTFSLPLGSSYKTWKSDYTHTQRQTHTQTWHSGSVWKALLLGWHYWETMGYLGGRARQEEVRSLGTCLWGLGDTCLSSSFLHPYSLMMYHHASGWKRLSFRVEPQEPQADGNLVSSHLSPQVVNCGDRKMTDTISRPKTLFSWLRPVDKEREPFS